ncbi:MAG TPA: GumC family protein [Thiolinea sp.]|nr:GumC family protein [Thiolinea sp.]
MRSGNPITIRTASRSGDFSSRDPLIITATAAPGTADTSGTQPRQGGLGRLLWRYKWPLLLSGLLGILLAYAFTLSRAASYQAESTLRLELGPTRVVEFGRLGGNEPPEALDLLQTEYELLKSRALARQVVAQMQLEDMLLNPPQGRWSPGDYLPDTGVLLQQGEQYLQDKGLLSVGPVQTGAAVAGSRELRVLEAFGRHLYIQPIEQSRLVKVFFEAPTPELAADITNTLVQTYIGMRGMNFSEAGGYAKDYLQQELDKARQALTDAEQRLVNYARERNILNLDDKQTVNIQKLNDLNQALVDAERRRVQAENRYQQLQASGSAQELINNPTLQAMKTSLATMEADYQQKLALFKPAYPDMQLLRSQIDDMRRTLGRESANVGKALQAELASAQGEEQTLRGRLEKLNQDMLATQDRSVEYNTIQREVDTNRKLYESLLQRQQEVSVASGANPGVVRVIDPAVPPLEPFSPKLPLNLLIGLLGGLFAGLIGFKLVM